ncbi:ABC transporter ATP-binding protein [Bacillus sp. H-16]|uniref:ABC transporter ATP-binding protein n=1 Tax=Alteribacter salitolerans TaxID=2912333 RepID=UPI00196651AD|nr:ABC transporter ATP-binding protein [Alteribacter salitolerans]MBM7097477.1 ABC transporter ATP-binding protein [Alteribacter salitolerans]
MNAVTCSHLTKTYREKKAVNDLSVSIEENKITGIIGRNGAGKTTFLQIVAGFQKPTSGEVMVFGENPFNSLNASANTIFINDTMNLPNSLTVYEILESAASFYPNWDKELAERLFEYFSFQRSQRHDRLSKGMRSTFNMILGLSSRCPLTIFDEPTTGMDAAVRSDFYRALLKDYLAHPRTILLSSHHLNEIEELIEDVFLIKDGTGHLYLSVSDLKEYGVGIQGPDEQVEEWIEGIDVFHKRDIPVNKSYAVIKREDLRSGYEKAGLTVSPVSATDMSMYLTEKRTGGIDDVFNRS